MEAPLCVAQQRYAALLSLVPQCKEAYESVDAAGATTRRFATVGDQAGGGVVDGVVDAGMVT